MPQRGASNRREFLKGPLRDIDGDPNGVVLPGVPPSVGSTVRLNSRAMACDFSVVMNPGPTAQINVASSALELIQSLEQVMTVYRDDSELSLVNFIAPDDWADLSDELLSVLRLSLEIAAATDGAFDPTSHPFIELWRNCRNESRVPSNDEIAHAAEAVGHQHVELDETTRRIRYLRPEVGLNLGGIGKGFALDRAADQIRQAPDAPDGFLLHGGFSSLIACGPHHNSGCWPVGIGNPLFTQRRLGRITLRDQAMSTSGSNIQAFRLDGRRFGHIVDPRTGWPVDGMLSVTVVSPSAATADALSTAFFVMGVENTLKCCDNQPDVGVVLVPMPTGGKRVRPVVRGIPESSLFWDDDQIETVEYVS